ncbi:hypothetical protein BDV59DRAFT_203887 [Aspergillus ambiguus]|uniref:uncharacterized protein n=1 Tax=Aspergillus ambiguus TaxID=176160 RepID=UPI003CCE1F52
MTLPEQYIYEHGSQIVSLLTSNLPHCCSVLRRIQHGIAYPTPTAKILATFPAGTTPTEPWLVAHVDLFCGRETQILVYSSLEAKHSATIVTDGIQVSTFDAEPTILAQVRAQLLAMISYIKTNLLPAYLSSLKDPASAAAMSGDFGDGSRNGGTPALIPAPDPRAFLFGSLHTGLFALLQKSGSYLGNDPLDGLRVHRFDNPPYCKYVFPRSEFDPRGSGGATEISDLPTGYRYHDRRGRTGVLPSQFGLVQSRTHIPRSKEQLATMLGVAVYYDDPSDDASRDGSSLEGDDSEAPIAWGFLGKDGALATLHVEPEHRGRGLALRLSKEVMRRGMEPQGVLGVGSASAGDHQFHQIRNWAHTEVAQGNQASRRVMEKIGGEVMAMVGWTVIEVC